MNRTFNIGNQTMSTSISSVKVFIDYIITIVTDYQTGLKTFYNDYLTLVNLKLTPNVTFASYRKADSIYTKLILSLDKFLAALREDHYTTKKLAHELQSIHLKRKQLANQKNDRNKVQLIGKITNMSKVFNQLAKDYQEKVNNFHQLQNNLTDKVIIYNSLSGKTFNISLNNDYTEFLELLGVTEESGLLEIINNKFIDEFSSKIDSLNVGALESVSSLNPIDPETNQPNQPNQPNRGQPTQEPRPHFNLHVVDLVSSINVQDLLRDVAVMVQNDKVIKILLQSAKTQLFNKFNTWQNKFVNLPLYEQFIGTFYQFILPSSSQPQEAHLELERIARELVNNYNKLPTERKLYSISDVLKIDRNNGHRIDFLKNWFTWTTIVYLYNYFETEDGINRLETQLASNQKDIRKWELELSHRSILIYLYGRCLASLEGYVQADSVHLKAKRKIAVERYKDFVGQKVKVFELKIKYSENPSEALRTALGTDIQEQVRIMNEMKESFINAITDLQNPTE